MAGEGGREISVSLTIADISVKVIAWLLLAGREFGVTDSVNINRKFDR